MSEQHIARSQWLSKSERLDMTRLTGESDPGPWKLRSSPTGACQGSRDGFRAAHAGTIKQCHTKLQTNTQHCQLEHPRLSRVLIPASIFPAQVPQH